MNNELNKGWILGAVIAVVSLALGAALGLGAGSGPQKIEVSLSNPLVENSVAQAAPVAPVLGGGQHLITEDFAEGISVDGTTIIDGSGAISVTSATLSGAATLGSTLSVAATSTFTGYASGVDFYESKTLTDATSTIASVCADDGQKLLITNAKLLIPASASGAGADAYAGRFIGIYVANNGYSSSTQMLAGGSYTTSTLRQWLAYDSRNLGTRATTTIMAASNFVLTSGQCVNAWVNKAASSTISTNTDGMFEVGYRKLN